MAFRGATYLEKVTIKHGVVYIGTSFLSECKKIKTIYLPNTLDSFAIESPALEFVNLEQGFKCNLNISKSTLYSVETLVAIFENLADLTGQTAKTLTIGSVNLAKLTAEQKAIATSKNWTLA
jgi:hypothetical protein